MTDQQFTDLVDRVVRRIPYIIGWGIAALAFTHGWVQYFGGHWL